MQIMSIGQHLLTFIYYPLVLVGYNFVFPQVSINLTKNASSQPKQIMSIC